MSTGNGYAARLDAIQREVDQLWRTKASTESVQNLKEDVGELATKESVQNLKMEVAAARSEIGGLRRVLIVTAVSWAGGSGAFLIAVLQLTSG